MCPPDFRCPVVADSLLWNVEMEIPDAPSLEAAAQTAKPATTHVHNTATIFVAAPIVIPDWARKYFFIFLLAPFCV
jgi:hypothetical protein